MRHGFDVATRIKPPRYEDAQRAADCQLIADSIAVVAFDPIGIGEGETFPSTDIDVGAAASDRSLYESIVSSGTYYTNVEGTNPANADGTIDTVDTWFAAGGAGSSVKAGTFSASGNDLTCRDAQSIGEVAVGANSVSGLDIDVVTGDYIGIDGRANVATQIDRDSVSAPAFRWRATGQYCDANDTATFVPVARTNSIYGTGDTGAAEPDISNDCSTYNFGVVKVGTTYNSTLDYFNLTNVGGVAVNVTIGATDAVNATAGTDNWTLDDNATPGVDIFGLKAGIEGDDFDIIIRKAATFNNLVVNLAAGNSQPWGIKLYTPTEINNGDPKRTTVTLTAAAA
jgi:hypothetical protein